MYYVSAQGVDERMINVHYYYYKGKLSGPQIKILSGGDLLLRVNALLS